jgi:hypothetical protein
MKFNSARAEWTSQPEVTRRDTPQDEPGYMEPDVVRRRGKLDADVDYSAEDTGVINPREFIEHWLRAPRRIPVDYMRDSAFEGAEEGNFSEHESIADWHESIAPYITKMLFAPVNDVHAHVERVGDSFRLKVKVTHDRIDGPNYNYVLPVTVKNRDGSIGRAFRYFYTGINSPESNAGKPVIPFSTHRALREKNESLAATHKRYSESGPLPDALEGGRIRSVWSSADLHDQLMPLLWKHDNSACKVQDEIARALRATGLNIDLKSLSFQGDGNSTEPGEEDRPTLFGLNNIINQKAQQAIGRGFLPDSIARPARTFEVMQSLLPPSSGTTAPRKKEKVRSDIYPAESIQNALENLSDQPRSLPKE